MKPKAQPKDSTYRPFGRGGGLLALLILVQESSIEKEEGMAGVFQSSVNPSNGDGKRGGVRQSM